MFYVLPKQRTLGYIDKWNCFPETVPSLDKISSLVCCLKHMANVTKYRADYQLTLIPHHYPHTGGR